MRKKFETFQTNYKDLYFAISNRLLCDFKDESLIDEKFETFQIFLFFVKTFQTIILNR